MSTANNNTTASAAPGSEHLHITSDMISRIAELTAASVALRQQDGAFFSVAPADYAVKDITKVIEAAAPTPRRKTGTVHLSSIDSFTKFITDQAATDKCYIYADPDSRTLTAVLNDQVVGADAPAGWRDHRAVYTAELSREFASWMTNSGVKMDQEQFAVFLEDNIADVVEPSGDVLLAVALTLQAKTEVEFKSHRRLDNGQVQLGYIENTAASAGADGSLTIPREFALGLRLFKHGVGYKIKARLKYRLGSGKLKFWYELDRPENVVEDAFAAYVSSAVASGYTVLMGKP